LQSYLISSAAHNTIIDPIERLNRIQENFDARIDESLNADRGCDVMKAIFMIFLILLTGPALASAYTPEQQTALEGMRLSFQLGAAYQEASQGLNVAEFNALADEYNKFVIANFGEDPNLLMSKMNGAAATPLYPAAMPQYLTGVSQRAPFNDTTDLSKFGKQEVLAQLTSNDEQNRNIAEANMADWFLYNF